MENEEVKATEPVEQVEKTFTQAQLDTIVKERLERAEEKWQKKYSGYYSEDDLASKTEELRTQIATLGNSLQEADSKATADADEISKRDQKIADLEAKVQTYETDSAKIRIALEVGIPYELASRLQGTTEEEIKEDALKMLPLVAPKTSMPARNPNSAEVDGVTAAFQRLNPGLKF